MTNYNLPSLPSTHYWDVREHGQWVTIKLMKYGKLKDKCIDRLNGIHPCNVVAEAEIMKNNV